LTLFERLKKRRGLTIAAVVMVFVVVLAGVVVLQFSLDNASTRSGWKDSTPFDATRSILDVLGGVRQSLAAIMWSRTDTLFHEYFGGDLSKEQLIFPYYRLITKLDPHFEMAYYFASFILCRLGRVKQGVALALEGVRNNPNSDLLQENLAEIYLFFLRDAKKAKYHVEKAIRLSHDPDQISVYQNLLKVSEAVIAGKTKVPPMSSLKPLQKLHEQQEKEEQQHGGE
jgi:tetratricopeptide (TPR) repeat protein